MTTLAAGGVLPPATRKQLVQDLIDRGQRASGLIDMYAGYLDGGSVFSTLWAIRILRLLETNGGATKAVSRALDALDVHWSDFHRTSYKGFYFELLSQCEVARRRKREASVLAELLAAQGEDHFWDSSALFTAYVISNLCTVPEGQVEAVRGPISAALRSLLSLESSEIRASPVLEAARKEMVDSAYLQLCLRVIIAGTRALRVLCEIDPAHRVIATVVSAYPLLHYAARTIEVRLKQMDQQYGEIQGRFAHIEEAAGPILAQSPFESNVFIMMPFRQARDERFETIERAIRRALLKKNLRGWLASDIQVSPQLWDNVAAYLTACKYGIAVFTRLETNGAILPDFNPNVSLELGFCLSRGRKVLILKDSYLQKLNTDLVGHLYSEFDLNTAGRQLPGIVSKWAASLRNDGASG